MVIPQELYKQICEVLPVACVDLLIEDDNGKVLLVKRANEPAKGQWWFPGGRVHFGETRLNAAIRKLKEECNLVGYDFQELGTFDLILPLPNSPLPSHAITTLYYTRITTPKDLILDNQSEEAAWNYISDWQIKDLHPFVINGLLTIMGQKSSERKQFKFCSTTIKHGE